MEIKSLQERICKENQRRNRENTQALVSLLGEEIPSTSEMNLGYKGIVRAREFWLQFKTR